jgi:hypothetical protein
MRIISVFIITCALAAITPFRPTQPTISSGDRIPYALPDRYRGQKLESIAMTAREKQFYRSFPGKMAKMTDGKRQITYKWIERPTRKLHPASDCYRGMGYSIHPEPIRIDEDGRRWGASRAAKGRRRIRVEEQISDRSNRQWTDVSSWYWAAFLGRSQGPWQVITVSERISTPLKPQCCKGRRNTRDYGHSIDP